MGDNLTYQNVNPKSKLFDNFMEVFISLNSASDLMPSDSRKLMYLRDMKINS